MMSYKVIVLFALFCVFCSGIEATPTATPCYDEIKTKYVSPKCEGIGYDYAYETGRCYKFHSEFMSWIDAREVCKNEGGDLAVMNSEAEARVVVILFKKYPAESVKSSVPDVKEYALVGFYYSSTLGSWKTIEGQILEQAGYNKQKLPVLLSPKTHSFGLINREGLLWNGDHGSFMFICEKGSLA